jgi:hypothetical protein
MIFESAEMCCLGKEGAESVDKQMTYCLMVEEMHSVMLTERRKIYLTWLYGLVEDLKVSKHSQQKGC